jgi:hypothetical protein
MPYLHRLNFSGTTTGVEGGTLDVVFPTEHQFEMFFMETITDLVYYASFPVPEEEMITTMIKDAVPTKIRREPDRMVIEYSRTKFHFLKTDLIFDLKPLSLAKTFKWLNEMRRDLFHLQSAQFSSPSATSSASE